MSPVEWYRDAVLWGVQHNPGTVFDLNNTITLVLGYSMLAIIGGSVMFNVVKCSEWYSANEMDENALAVLTIVGGVFAPLLIVMMICYGIGLAFANLSDGSAQIWRAFRSERAETTVPKMRVVK